MHKMKMELHFTKRILLPLLAVMVAGKAMPQTISGSLTSTRGEKILTTNILVKDSVNTERAREFVIARNGAYSITLRQKYRFIIVEVSAPRYKKEFYAIENPVADKSYTVNFILQKDTVKQLPEVIVTAKALPFKIKHDTVSYNVASYRDGSERKIEDVIKKLPGVDVNESTGAITYKGKPVETVKLDGDDLFGSNYTLGTKNINVDMVDQVQAIENYHDNPLLKGIESGDKVALNLTLKPHKTDISGSAGYGGGLNADANMVHDAGADILGVSKKYKSFATFSYNNIGKNNTPLDYFAYNPNAEELKESALAAAQIIPETYFTSDLGNNRANINNALFGNLNFISKFTKKMSFKTNLFYIKDKILSDQLFEDNYVIDDQTFKTSDNYHIEKKPLQYRGDVEIKYNTSKTSLLEYKCRISHETINTPATVLQNNTSDYQSYLNTKDFIFRQSLLFTQKITAQKAWQLSVSHSFNDVPQEFLLEPSVYNPAVYSGDKQLSNFKKTNLNVQSTFLGSRGKWKCYFSTGGAFSTTPFQSMLINRNETVSDTANNFINQFNYKKNIYSNQAGISCTLGSFRISPSYSLSFLKQTISNNPGSKDDIRTDVVFEPAISATLKLNSISAILASAGYNRKPADEGHLFYNPVYTSNRTSVQNIPALQLQKGTSYNLFYLLNDLYNQVQLNASVLYNKTKGNFFANNYINANNTAIEYFFLPVTASNFNVNFSAEKYIPFIESTIRVKGNASVSRYKNTVNNSDLRNNESRLHSADFFIKTAFDFKINFEEVMRYNKSRSQSNGSGAFSNEAISNTFKIIVKPNRKCFFLLSSEYFLPDTKNKNEDYLFLDATLRVTLKPKICDMNFMAKNILNNSNFRQVQTTDFSENIFQTNLLPAYYMLSLSYNF